MTPIISQLLPAEYEVILDIAPQAFMESYAHHNSEENMRKYMSQSFNPEQIKSELTDSRNYFFVAHLHNALVGYTKLRTSEAPEQLALQNPIELERIYVLKKYHDQKLGAALMSHAIQFAKEQAHQVLWLGVWQGNHRAVQFYQRWGFETFGTHEFMLGDDRQTDWLLNLSLKS